MRLLCSTLVEGIRILSGTLVKQLVFLCDVNEALGKPETLMKHVSNHNNFCALIILKSVINFSKKNECSMFQSLKLLNSLIFLENRF